MAKSPGIFARYVLPFLQWYALMILFAIAIDYALHRMGWIHAGIYMGYIGTGLIIFSFVYSLRKRKIITSGSPKQLLNLHEYMSWLGAVCILVHAGIHFNAILPWLALGMMLIAVASGLIGKFLLKKAAEELKEIRSSLRGEGHSEEEVQKKLFFDSLTVDLMKKWRVVHMPITLLLGILSVIHILTVIIFNK